MAATSVDVRGLICGERAPDRRREMVRGVPWWLLSLVVHVLILTFAYHYTWEVRLTERPVEFRPAFVSRPKPPPVVAAGPLPRSQESSYSVSSRRQAVQPRIERTLLYAVSDILPPRAVPDGGPKAPDAPRSVFPVLPPGPSYIRRVEDVEDWLRWFRELPEVEAGRCLFVWLFDESRSMKDDQQLIRRRVDDLYADLAVGGPAGARRVLTGVASFGRDLHVLLAQPTADVARIREAIDRVPVDLSGDENVLRAINGALSEFGPYARRYARSLVIVLVTDEAGDDDATPKDGASPLELTVARMKAMKATLVVFGDEAGGLNYAREYVFDPAAPPGMRTWSWVNRGIDSAFAEMFPYDYLFRATERVPSGFGPWALSRLCRESGGTYFLLRRAGARGYDYGKLLEGYVPELGARLEIAGLNARHPARRLMMQLLDGWAAFGARDESPLTGYFNAGEPGRRQMAAAMKSVDERLAFVNEGIRRLDALANVSFADSPSAARWEANRDLFRAQLRKMRFQLTQVKLALADLARGERIPPAGDGGWHVGFDRAAVLRGDDATMKEELDAVRALYQQVIERHAGTPWEAFARSEMRSMRAYSITAWSPGAGSDLVDNPQ